MRQFFACAIGLVSVFSVALGQIGAPARLPQSILTRNNTIAVALSGDTAVVATVDSAFTLNPGAAVDIFRWKGSAWALEATLTAPDSSAYTNFGTAIAITNDTIFVSAIGETVGAFTDAGRVHVFSRSGTTWSHTAEFSHTDPASGDRFGTSLAVSKDTLVVGCVNKDTTGATYVFTRSGNSWSQQQKLTTSDAAPGDDFGFSVAIDGEYLIASAASDDSKTGSAYIFTRSGTTWTQQQKLTKLSGVTDDMFGYSVAIEGSIAAVGAPMDGVGANDEQGTVTVFSRSGTTWVRGQELVASNAAQEDWLGYSVAISNGMIAASAPSNRPPASAPAIGAIYLFKNVQGDWTEDTVLIDDRGAITAVTFGDAIAFSGDLLLAGQRDGSHTTLPASRIFSRVNNQWLTYPTTTTGATVADGDNFGAAVAMDGDYAVIGAYLDDAAGADFGSVYFVKYEGGLVVEQQKREAATAGSNLGRSVAIKGDYAAAGAPLTDATGPTRLDQGAVVVYERDGGTWPVLNTLRASDGLASDFLGQSVAMDGRTIIAGAHGDDTGAVTNHGSLYVFENLTTQVAKLLAPDKATGDLFGFASDINNDTIVVGAYGKDGSKGAAYIFIRENGAWTYKGKLVASDGVAADQFGYSVAIEKDIILVGAPNKGAGAVYVYGRNAAGAWPQVAKLLSPDPAAGDRFGQSVSIRGFTIAVSASGDDLPGVLDAGASYLFTTTTLLPTGPWQFDRKLTAPVPSAGSQLGFAIAVAGNTVLAGAPKNSAAKGNVTFFDFADADQFSVRNLTTSTAFPSLSAAITAATNNQSILAAAGSFETANIDFAGKALTIASRSSISLNHTGLLLLNNNARLDAAPGSGIDIFCPTITPADSGRAILSGEHIRFSNSITVEPGTLFLNTPSAEFTGTTNLRGTTSYINSTGDLTFNGILNAANGGQFTAARDININSMGNLRAPFFSAGGTVRLRDTSTLLAVNLTAAAFEILPEGGFNGGGMMLTEVHNSGKMLITNASLIYGSLTSVTDSVINLAGSSLHVYGPSTIAGGVLIGGSISGCPNCLAQPAAFTIDHSFSLDPNSKINFEGVIEIGGSFLSEITNPANFEMRAGTLRFNALTGASFSGPRTFEAMSLDYGPAGAATREFVPGAFPLATLELGPAPTTLTIINTHNNSASARPEALYLDSLYIPAGSRLNTGNTKIYTRSAQIDGIVDRPANIIALPGPCDADLSIDSIVDDTDFEVFVAAYTLFDCADPAMSDASASLPGGCPADLNADGLVDDADFSVFIIAYDAFVCP